MRVIKSGKSNKSITANTNRNQYMNSYRQSGSYHNTNAKRDVWKVGGLPEQLSFADFYNMYRRGGFAKAGIMRPVERCWSTLPVISDGKRDDDAEPTQFEKDVKYLIEHHELFERLIGLDYRQRVGRYGGIVLIAKQRGANGTISATSKLEGLGVKSIVKLMPVFESQIVVNSDNQDIMSPDFGNPEFYDFRSDALGARNDANASYNLHPSRVFACGEGADDGSIYGVPFLEAAYNPLLDWEKVRVASAEGLYKNAKQRINVSINDDETAMAYLDEDTKDQFTQSVNDFGDGWDSALLTAGMDVKTLQSSIQDPTGNANLILQELVAAMGIPKTILIGFETGERSSTENSKVYNTDMMSRRNNFLSKMIKSFLQQLIDTKLLTPPTSGEINVEWDDLLASSDDEKLNNSDKMVTINQKSFQSGSGQIFTDEEIREIAGFDQNTDEEMDIMDDSGYDDLMDKEDVADDDQEEQAEDEDLQA